MTPVRLLTCASLFLALLLLGCSKGNPGAPAKIEGSVTYQGQPVKGGTVQFVTPEGTAYSTQIGGDGTYSISDVPDGELVITVETESVNPDKKTTAAGKDAEKRMKMTQQPPPEGRGGGATPAEKVAQYRKIPDKYGKAQTSPRTVNARSGRQVHNIELTD
jgi:hypothetical protein